MSGNEPDQHPGSPVPESDDGNAGAATPSAAGAGYQPPPPFAPPTPALSPYAAPYGPPGGQGPYGNQGEYPPSGYPSPGIQGLYPPPGYQHPGQPYPPPGQYPSAGDQQPIYQHPGYQQPFPPRPGYARPAAPARPRSLFRRRSVLTAASVVGVFAVVSAIAATQNGTSTPKPPAAHRLVLPASFAGYSQLSDQNDRRIAENLRDGLMKSSPDFADAYRQAQIGLYESASGAQLVAVAIPAATVPPSSRNALAHDPGSVATARLSENGAASEADFPPGPLGGALKCGPHATGDAAVCSWADASTVGLVLASSENQGDPNQAAADTLSLRNAAEH